MVERLRCHLTVGDRPVVKPRANFCAGVPETGGVGMACGRMRAGGRRAVGEA